jgi:hypothetical protein
MLHAAGWLGRGLSVNIGPGDACAFGIPGQAGIRTGSPFLGGWRLPSMGSDTLINRPESMAR